nr:hypothetical protein [Lachnospiraceae bacterium]
MRKRICIMACIFSILVFVMMGCGSTQETPATAEPEESVEAVEEETIDVAEDVAEETEPQTESKKPKRGQKTTVHIKDQGYATFELTSEDLHDGVWDSVITNTENGKNVSPQMKWEAVPEAESYVVYMTDTMAGDWMHWISSNVTETELPQGWAPEGEYIGPYPPGGTHTYEVYVIALRQAPEKVGGTLDSSNIRFMRDVLELDVLPDGSKGNIVAYGHLAGTYTYGD